MDFPNQWWWHQFPNLGYISTEFTPEQLQPVKDEIEEIKQDFSKATPFNLSLAGNLKREFELLKCKEHVNSLMAPLGQIYINQFGYKTPLNFTSIKDPALKVDRIWANFQTKHEFNPMHTHYGVLSFVIYLQVPYTIEEEKAAMEGPPDYERRPGHFSFYYTDALGTVRACDLPTERSWEGKCIIFPAPMTHAVYPFYTSDEFRISVAGNLIYTPQT